MACNQQLKTMILPHIAMSSNTGLRCNARIVAHTNIPNITNKTQHHLGTIYASVNWWEYTNILPIHPAANKI